MNDYTALKNFIVAEGRKGAYIQRYKVGSRGDEPRPTRRDNHALRPQGFF